MASTRREVYEAGRADERSEIVAWLRSAESGPFGGPDPALADALADGKHAEAVVLGAEVPG